uniref:PAZ domain-containing protein n=2 Tax=Aegilops tauschii subsp. strangulata TaxID=200361 RepID=A0A452YES9_AEGTS
MYVRSCHLYCSTGHPCSCKRMNGSLQSWYWYKSYQCSGSTQLQDISCKPFINPLPVINLVALLLNRDISDDPFDFCERLKVSKDLCDVEVNFTLEKNADKKYRITGLTSQGSSQLPCPCDDSGTGKTVVEYFKETYRRTIRSRVPCLKVRDQEKPTTYLPMEVCEISDAKQISYLLSVACQHPMDHEKTILQTVNPYNEDPHAKEFGITFENKLTIVKGRVLPPPVVSIVVNIYWWHMFLCISQFFYCISSNLMTKAK